MNSSQRPPTLQEIDWEIASRSVVYFVRNYVWTYDPRLPVPIIRLIPFPKQEEFLLWLDERERTQTNGLAEKSRDMGFTWLCCAYLVHRWLFRSGFKGAVGSRKSDLVDKIGDPDCIFEKLRFIIEHLPPEHIPAGYEKVSGLGKLINPLNGSTITGEGGDNIGRGGRSSVYFVDEAGFLDHPKKVDAALSANTNVRIDISTPNGNGNPFAQKRFSGRTPVFSMHWKDDPRKNRWQIINPLGDIVQEGEPNEAPPETLPNGYLLIYPWYEQLKNDCDDITIAQEYDIDYTASLEGIAIPAKWVQPAIDLCRRVALPRNGPVIAAMDVADGGKNDSILATRQGPVVSPLYKRKEGNTTDTANWAIDHCRLAKAQYLNYDSVGVGSGVTATLSVCAREGRLFLNFRGVNVGEGATDKKWPDGRTAKERFVNLKAELWWTVRERFHKTFEFVEKGIPHPLDELISIPNDPELIQQLSNVLAHKTEAGKISIEKKDELRIRGVASPDKAEMLMLLFADTAQPITLAAGGARTDVTSYQVR